MSLLNVTCRPFPRVLSSPSAPSSRPSASATFIARSRCNSPSAPAGVSLAEWLTQNTGYEPKLANFFSYVDLEHTPINTPDSHHDFLCPDDVTTIPTSPEGLPNTEASSSSKQAAASRVSSLFPVSGNTVHVTCRVVLASRKLGQSWTVNLLQQRFTLEREERSRHKHCAFVERQKNLQNIFRCHFGSRCCSSALRTLFCDRWSTTLTGDTMSGVARDVAETKERPSIPQLWRHELMAGHTDGAPQPDTEEACRDPRCDANYCYLRRASSSDRIRDT